MEENSLSAKEAARLIDWLLKHGHNYEDACKCIEYIANEQEKAEKA